VCLCNPLLLICFFHCTWDFELHCAPNITSPFLCSLVHSCLSLLDEAYYVNTQACCVPPLLRSSYLISLNILRIRKSQTLTIRYAPICPSSSFLLVPLTPSEQLTGILTPNTLSIVPPAPSVYPTRHARFSPRPPPNELLLPRSPPHRIVIPRQSGRSARAPKNARQEQSQPKPQLLPCQDRGVNNKRLEIHVTLPVHLRWVRGSPFHKCDLNFEGDSPCRLSKH